MGNLARDVLRATLYFLSANCAIRSKAERIKSTDFPTCTHVRESHACYWYRLSMYLLGPRYPRKQCRLPAACSNKALNCRNVYL